MYLLHSQVWSILNYCALYSKRSDIYDRGFDHVSVFNQEILNPSKYDMHVTCSILMISVTEGNSNDARKEALDKLRLITDRIMLRRVKRDHTAAMELPPKRLVS